MEILAEVEAHPHCLSICDIGSEFQQHGIEVDFEGVSVVRSDIEMELAKIHEWIVYEIRKQLST